MSRSLRLAVPVAAAVILADQITKHAAVSNLQPGVPQHVVWTLQWNLSFNHGMAFSTGTGMGVLIGLVAIVVSIVVLRVIARRDSMWQGLAAGLVIGGALGNVADRLFRGRGWLRGGVVDFVDFQWFPIFNLADTAVNLGAATYVVWSLLRDWRHGDTAAA